MTIEPQAYDPVETRQRVLAALAKALPLGVPAIPEAVDAIMTIVNDVVVKQQLQTLGDYLATLPEQERKAKMYDVLASIGALQPPRKGRQ